MVIPARVGIGLLILGGIFGFLVGKGASPWVLLVLPMVTTGIIWANRRSV